MQLADKIAYINHDIDDAIRGGILLEKDLPATCTQLLGNSTRDRLNTIIHDVIANSEGKGDIVCSPDIRQAMTGLRSFLFDTVYTNPVWVLYFSSGNDAGRIFRSNRTGTGAGDSSV